MSGNKFILTLLSLMFSWQISFGSIAQFKVVHLADKVWEDAKSLGTQSRFSNGDTLCTNLIHSLNPCLQCQLFTITEQGECEFGHIPVTDLNANNMLVHESHAVKVYVKDDFSSSLYFKGVPHIMFTYGTVAGEPDILDFNKLTEEDSALFSFPIMGIAPGTFSQQITVTKGRVVFITGGQDLNTGQYLNNSYKFNIGVDATTPVTPISNMLESRYQHDMTLLAGRPWAIGGRTPDSITETTEIYNEQLDQWFYGPDLPLALMAPCTVYLDNDRVMLIGGNDVNNTGRHETYIYDIKTGIWEEKAAMTTGRSRLACGLVEHGNGTKFVIAAFGKTHSAVSTSQDTGELYNFDTNQWSQIANAPFKLNRLGGVGVNNYFYSFGGIQHDTSKVDYITRYDVNTNGWTLLPQVVPNKIENPDAALFNVLHL